MAIVAVISAIGAAIGVASSIVKLVGDIRAAAGTDNLGDRDLKRLEDSLRVLDQVPEILGEMRTTMEAPPQKAILSRDDRPNLQQLFGTLADRISFQLEGIRAPLQTLDVTKQKLTPTQVDRMRDAAADLVNSLELDSGSKVKKALERENLFSMALMVDNIGVFASRDYSNDADVRDALRRSGRFTTSVRSYEDDL